MALRNLFKWGIWEEMCYIFIIIDSQTLEGNEESHEALNETLDQKGQRGDLPHWILNTLPFTWTRG